MVDCAKTYKSKARGWSLQRSGNSTARDLLSREGDSNPIDGLVTRNHQVGSFETICCAAQEGGSAVAGSFIVLKPLKTGRSTDRFSGPALEPHGNYSRAKAIRTLFDYSAASSRETIR